VELIQLKGVTKTFGKNTILQDVNLTIEEGDIFGIVGASGSGKTTLLNLLSGFIEPSQGKALYYSSITHGPRDLNEHIHHLKKFIGFTPQHNSFYHRLSVKENLLHFGKMYGIERGTLITNIKSLLRFTQLFDHRNKLGEHLSGGQQKRLDISCSLVHKPKVLILDEPTADLDPILQQEITDLLRAANKQGVTIIIASHHLDSVESLCNKIAIVHNGGIHSQGLLEEIRKPFLRDYLTVHVNSENKNEIIAHLRRARIKNIVDKGNKLIVHPLDNTETSIKSIMDIVNNDNLHLRDMEMRKPSLNEIFQEIVK
jgi:ABC-2 type transport system ATP-binding protein